jgi:hypothetical protein
MGVVYVNTWRTKNVPMTVFGDEPAEALARVREAVLKLPVRVNLPQYVSELSLPRYYAIFYRFDGEKLEIVDVVGVHYDWSPTKWSYRFGYWHPRCQLDIARALETAIAERQEAKQTS